MKHASYLVLVANLACAAAPDPTGDGPRTPDAERATFASDPGVELRWVAAEPAVRSPAALAWDEAGVLHVAENPGYPVGPGPGREPEGAVVRLLDRDGDGRCETRQVFAEGLNFPNGLLRWRGGWLVTDAPNVWWLKDSDGDGRADVRELWFTGFATNSTTQLRVCYPTLGPDGWIYLARGLSGGVIVSPRWTNLPPVDLKGGDFRFRPDGSRAEAIGGNAQFGLVVDDVGRRFLASNRNPLMHAVVTPRWWARHPALPFADLVQDVSPTGYEAKVFPRSADSTTAGYMPEFMAAPHAGTFTAACGIHRYFGEALPEAYVGDWFVCEPAQNLVQRQRATPEGPTFRSRRVPEDRDFLASTDGWFRPVFAATGPDGALYLADFYRKVIDHPEYLPVEVRGRLDFDAGKHMGRIWRVAGEATRTRGADLASATVPELAALLGATNLWVRETAHRLLWERPVEAWWKPILEALDRELAPVFVPARDATRRRRADDPPMGPHVGMVRRLGLVGAAIGGRSLEEQVEGFRRVERALFDASPSVREVAWRVLQASGVSPETGLPARGMGALADYAEDPCAAVRFQCALWLGDRRDRAAVLPALVRVAVLDGGDRWVRAAVASGLRGVEAAFVRAFYDAVGSDRAAHAPMLGDLAALSAGADSEEAGRFLVERAMEADASGLGWAIPAMTRFAEGARARGRGDLGAHVRRWAEARGDGPGGEERWQAFMTRVIRSAGPGTSEESVRVSALRFSAELDWDRVRGVLGESSKAGESEAVRLAAVRALGRFDAIEAGRMLVEPARWEAWSQPIRAAALSAVAERGALVPALLEALERGSIPIWAVEPGRRRSLQAHGDPAVRERAKRLFANAGGEDRRKVYEDWKSVLAMSADGARGRDVFRKACATCHKRGAEGVAVGPDLTGVRNQPAEALLLHVVVPDAEIYPGYQACEVETTDGRSLTGLVTSETGDRVILRKAGGEEESLPRASIRSLTRSRVSLMPQELEKTVSRQEMADLIAFLKGGG